MATKPSAPAVTVFKYFINIIGIVSSSAWLLNPWQHVRNAFLHTSKIQALKSYTKQSNKHHRISQEIEITHALNFSSGNSTEDKSSTKT